MFYIINYNNFNFILKYYIGKHILFKINNIHGIFSLDRLGGISSIIYFI